MICTLLVVGEFQTRRLQSAKRLRQAADTERCTSESQLVRCAPNAAASAPANWQAVPSGSWVLCKNHSQKLSHSFTYLFLSRSAIHTSSVSYIQHKNKKNDKKSAHIHKKLLQLNPSAPPRKVKHKNTALQTVSC